MAPYPVADVFNDQDIQAMKDRVSTKLEEKIRCPEEQSKRFITAADLESVWPDDILLRLVAGSRWPCLEARYIKANFLKIISILLQMDAREQLLHFMDTFMDPKKSSPIKSDKDLPFDKDGLRLLRYLPTAANKETFQFWQSVFCPAPIILSPQGNIQEININMRLPLENVGDYISTGSFAEVRKVRIPARHAYLNLNSGMNLIDHPTYYACKKFKTNLREFDTERKRLRVLQQCLVQATSVMLHVGAIRHGDELRILFPYAVHHDLQIFLDGGLDVYQTRLYVFNERFPGSQDQSDLIRGTLVQMTNLATALAWLHHELRTQDGEPIQFAHMDLKPNNILIADRPLNSPPSDEELDLPVGFWMLSDFGISADDTEESGPSSHLHVQDRSRNNTTLNTRPRRIHGPHSAPEVEELVLLLGQVERLEVGEKGLGRSSDMWSFGCIFVEVLSFALGKNKGYSSFVAKRGIGSCFYQKTATSYTIRQTVLQWLDDLPNGNPTWGGWLECACKIAERMLTVNADFRPKAVEVRDLMHHSLQHFKNLTKKGRTQCPTLGTRTARENAALRTSGSLRMRQQTRMPPHRRDARESEDPEVGSSTSVSIIRTGTGFEEVLDRVSLSTPQLEQASGVRAEQRLPPLPEEIQGSNLSGPQTRSTAEQHSRPDASDNSPDLRSVNRQRPAERLSRTRRGLFIDSDVTRHVVGSRVIKQENLLRLEQHQHRRRSFHKEEKPKVSALALSPCARKVALVATVDSRSALYVSAINLAEGVSIPDTPQPLPAGSIWEEVAIAGSSIAVRGQSDLKRDHFATVYLVDWAHRNQPIQPPTRDEIPSLTKIAVSARGTVAYLDDERIILSPIESYQPLYLTGKYGNSFTLNRTFSDVVFNDTGDFLYAWAFNNSREYHYVWRVDDTTFTERTTKPDQETKYRTGQDYQGGYGVTLAPYNDDAGSIIQTLDKRFFPSHCRPSQVNRDEPVQPNAEICRNVIANCVFDDHSMITVEASRFRRHGTVREYQIKQDGNHVLNTDYKEIYELQTKPSTDPKKRTIVKAVKNDNDRYIVVYHPDVGIEIVRLKPTIFPD